MNKVILIAMSALLSGCSFILVDQAPEPELWNTKEALYLECEDSYLWPLADAVGTVGSALNAALAQQAIEEEAMFVLYEPAPFIVQGIIYAASAAYGLSSVSKCNAFREHQRILREQVKFQSFRVKSKPISRADPVGDNFQITQ